MSDLLAKTNTRAPLEQLMERGKTKGVLDSSLKVLSVKEDDCGETGGRPGGLGHCGQREI